MYPAVFWGGAKQWPSLPWGFNALCVWRPIEQWESLSPTLNTEQGDSTLGVLSLAKGWGSSLENRNYKSFIGPINYILGPDYMASISLFLLKGNNCTFLSPCNHVPQERLTLTMAARASMIHPNVIPGIGV